MFERFKVTNFKSFKEAEIKLRPLTVMVGANASGKTNFIEAIGLLAWLAGGQQLTNIYSSVRDRDLALRGVIAKIARHGNERPITFSISTSGEPMQRLALSLTLTPSPQFSHALVELADSGTHEYSPSAEELSIDRLWLKELPPDSNFEEPRWLIHRQTIYLSMLSSKLAGTLILTPSPSEMRGYSDDETGLRPDCANISAMLMYLDRQEGLRDKILDFVRALPEQDITDIDFIVTERGDRMVKVLESFGGEAHWQDAGVLSDGTLRALALAAAVLSIPRGSLLIIEDIDDGIHPSRLERLLALLRRHAEERTIRILVTSHNPSLLDAISDEELRHVVACYRDPEEGDSRLVELGELDAYPELLAQGRLGSLVTEGILDRALKEDPKARAAAALKWIDELEVGE